MLPLKTTRTKEAKTLPFRATARQFTETESASFNCIDEDE